MPPFLHMLQALIAQPSISSANAAQDMSNLAVIELLAQWLKEIGFSIEIQDLPSNKANLIATLGSGPGGLVLAGHTDTVPCDDSLWQSDPLTLSDRDQRFYGLGSTDMKGFFAVALEAAREFCQRPLQQPLIVLATADEETSMAGARALAAAGIPKARYAVIGEPTGLKPVHCHKGVMMESIALEGKSGHSSNPALGRSALDSMHRVIGELMTLRHEWGERYQNPAFEVIVPTLNLASIHGGDATNRICRHCELRFDVRLLPGMQNEEIRQQIRQRIERSLEGSAVTAHYQSLFPGVEPYLEPVSSELLKFSEQLTGHRATAASFATEAPFLQQLGMQTMVLGPGDINCAHCADEYLAQDQIKPAISLLKSLIHEYCVKAQVPDILTA